MSSEGYDEDSAAPHPFDYIQPDQVQDLWGIGYTIVKRSRHPDPFYVPSDMVPHSRSYQWWHLVEDRVKFERTGWAAVPASRHDGYFMPFGHKGAIEIGGLGLFEKSKVEVDADKAAQIAAARQQVTDWAKAAGGIGISGAVRVGQTNTVVGDNQQLINKALKTIETTTRFPPDMLSHASEVFAERDRLYAELENAVEAGRPDQEQIHILTLYHAALEEDPDLLKGPAFHALLLPKAVENVRSKLGIKTTMLEKLKALKKGKSDE